MVFVFIFIKKRRGREEIREVFLLLFVNRGTSTKFLRRMICFSYGPVRKKYLNFLYFVLYGELLAHISHLFCEIRTTFVDNELECKKNTKTAS